MAFGANDDMVMNRNAKLFAGFNNIAGDRYIGAGRLRITARVVMNENKRR